MKFIFQYPDFHGLDGDMLDAGSVSELAILAEAHGWDGFSFTEHPAPTAKWLETGGHQSLDPFVALGHVAAVTKQAQNYLNSNPAGNKVLMTAALQPRPQAAATLQAYAASNPQQYAEFKAILAPLGEIQNQCGVAVVPPQFQWAFDQFVGS